LRIFVASGIPDRDVNVEMINRRLLYRKQDFSELTEATPRPMVLGFLLDARISEEDALLPALGVVLALVNESSEAPAKYPKLKIPNSLYHWNTGKKWQNKDRIKITRVLEIHSLIKMKIIVSRQEYGSQYASKSVIKRTGGSLVIENSLQSSKG